MINNVKRFLRETKYTTVSFINTFNIMSIPSLKKFLEMILELRCLQHAIKVHRGID